MEFQQCIFTMKLYNACQGNIRVITNPVLYESLPDALPSIRVANSKCLTMLQIMQELKQSNFVGHKFLSSTRMLPISTQTQGNSTFQGREQIIPSFFLTAKTSLTFYKATGVKKQKLIQCRLPPPPSRKTQASIPLTTNMTQLTTDSWTRRKKTKKKTTKILLHCQTRRQE